MIERIVCLSLLRLTPGMRLARPVARADGAILMPAGAELEEESLRQLTQRGVEFAYVALPETRDPDAIASDVAAAEARVSYIFRGGAADEPGMGDMRNWLREAVLNYRRKGSA